MSNDVKLGTNGGLSTLALLLGIITILGFWTVAPAVFTAGLAFAFAFLSRGLYGMNGRAKWGVIFSVIGLILLAVGLAYVILRMGDAIFDYEPYATVKQIMLPYIEQIKAAYLNSNIEISVFGKPLFS